MLAFHHPRPVSAVHVAVVPKQHVHGVLDPKALDGKLPRSMLQAAQHIATSLALDSGTGFYVDANVIGPAAGANFPRPLRGK